MPNATAMNSTRVDSTRVEPALQRLNELLPLAQRQQQLTPAARDIHRQILHGFYAEGHAPAGADPAILRQLQQQDMIVLEGSDTDSPRVLGAYPFTLEQTPHRISLQGHTLHAMCALDALAVAPMFASAVTIESRCHISGVPVHIRQQGSQLLESLPDQPIQVGIRWQSPGQCAAHSLCREMVFLVGRDGATRWQGDTPDTHELFELPTAIALGSTFFSPLLSG